MASKKHYSNIEIYDSCIKVTFNPSDKGGVVTVGLLNEDTYVAQMNGREPRIIAFERWNADKDGYMTSGKYNEAVAYALGLSEARCALKNA